ncbi:MAG: HAMP domain-containing sensor histidine kinase [Lachnospiraceae bacterium]
MKYSINKQFSLIFSGLMAGTILVCWFANAMFLGDFYERHKQGVLRNAYDQIDMAVSDGNIQSDNFDVAFERISSRNNLDILILDSDTKTIISTVNDTDVLTERILSYFFRGTEKAMPLFSNNKYHVQKIFDSWMNMEFIELWGLLSNGNMIIIRSPMESIRESAMIANSFLAYVGATAIVISALVIWFISKKITEPILELANISEKMTRLDFDVKYKGDGSLNEVALLGRHINQLSETLEKTISELKTANNELQLDLARKNEIDEMRKEFLSNVSHELKTPIALIQGYSEGLKDCVNDDEESKDFYCDVIIDEAGKMNKIVKNLLELNQLECGNDSVVMERFDITELIRNCTNSIDIMLRQNEIKLVFNCKEPIYVWADEFKLEQIINNYLSNAIHYAAGEKVIEITIERVEGRIRIKVFNTGSPIPEESIPHLWTKFYKVDTARTREYGGSGIGLSIVKAIMDSMNQQYGVINYDNGVAFWFEVDGK